MLFYYNMADRYKPKVWISAKFPVGLFPKFNKLDAYLTSPTSVTFADIMGNNVEINNESVNDTITAYNIGHKIFDNGQYAFLLNTTSKIFINTITFKKDYTFIFVAKKTDATDTGSIFTSSLPDRIFGWRNSDIFYKCNKFVMSKPSAINDTNLHCFIIRFTKAIYNFWDFDKVLEPATPSFLNEDFGKVIIGGGKGVFSELILFDKALSDTAIGNITNFLNRYYKFHSANKNVVDNTLLQNLV
jgi:hypothetical protein